MVKHCREVDVAQGMLMGVMQGATSKDADGNIDENAIFNENTLLITQTIQKSNKNNMTDFFKAMENEQQRLMDTNEVGFYLNTRMGLPFTQQTLESMLACC